MINVATADPEEDWVMRQERIVGLLPARDAGGGRPSHRVVVQP